MSRTKLHKEKGKFNNGLLDEIPTDLQNLFNRHNWEVGERRKAKKMLQDKIADKELKQQLKTEKCKTYIPTTDTSKRCSICGELKYSHE